MRHIEDDLFFFVQLYVHQMRVFYELGAMMLEVYGDWVIKVTIFFQFHVKHPAVWGRHLRLIYIVEIWNYDAVKLQIQNSCVNERE